MPEIDPAAIESLREHLDALDEDEVLEELHDLCCAAWPTADSQSN